MIKQTMLFVLTAICLCLTVNGQAAQFYPVTPCRLADTRNLAPIPGGSSLTQAAAGFCGIPATAQAIVGNLTSVLPGANGRFTVYASDAPLPPTASSNYTAGSTLNNVFTVALGADGGFKIFTTATTHAVVDVTGYYAPPGAGGLYFHPLPSPVRLFDTRNGQSACTNPGAALVAGSTTTITGVGICGGVTIPATAKALVGNATTVSPAAMGYLTLFPADISLPTVASGNYMAGQTLNSQFYVGLSPSGEFSLFTLRTTEIVIDLTGYFSSDAVDINGVGLLFNSISPTRLLDTRVGGGMACNMPGVPLAGGAENSQAAQGTCSIAGTAQAIVGNATVVQPMGHGYLTLWPSDVSRPNTANSNYVTGQVFNRHFTVKLGSDGAFKIFSVATTNLVVDVVGYFLP